MSIHFYLKPYLHSIKVAVKPDSVREGWLYTLYLLNEFTSENCSFYTE